MFMWVATETSLVSFRLFSFWIGSSYWFTVELNWNDVTMKNQRQQNQIGGNWLFRLRKTTNISILRDEKLRHWCHNTLDAILFLNLYYNIINMNMYYFQCHHIGETVEISYLKNELSILVEFYSLLMTDIDMATIFWNNKNNSKSKSYIRDGNIHMKMRLGW